MRREILSLKTGLLGRGRGKRRFDAFSLVKIPYFLLVVLFSLAVQFSMRGAEAEARVGWRGYLFSYR